MFLAADHLTNAQYLRWLALFALVAALHYAASCAWWPYAKCGYCEGIGKRGRADGKVWRICPRCEGTGRRLRVGRQIYNWSRRDK